MPPAVRTYPVNLRVDGRRCLVVGGGPVAARKAAGLVACGALVTVVAPEVGADTTALATSGAGPGLVTVERRPYRAGEAAGYRLVVTATGRPAVDGAVAADAEAAGIWVNSADDPERCSFLLPSVHRDGPVVITVSTGGSSPALASWLRRRLAVAAGPSLGVLAGLLEEARHRVQRSGRSTETVDWAPVLDGPLPDLVRAGALDEARALLARVAEPPAGDGPGPGPGRPDPPGPAPGGEGPSASA